MMDEIDNRYKQKVITNMFETLRKKANHQEKKRLLVKSEMIKKMPHCFHYQSENSVESTDIVFLKPLERHVHGLDDGFHDHDQDINNINNDNVIRMMSDLQIHKELAEKNISIL